MTVRRYQASLNAGVMSPNVQQRTDTAGYQLGLRKCENFYALVQGPVKSRPRTKWIDNVDPDQTRLIEFRFDDGQEYVIAIGDNQTAIYDISDTSNVFKETTIGTPWAGSDVKSLRHAHNLDELFVVHPNYDGIGKIIRTLTGWEYVNEPLTQPPTFQFGFGDGIPEITFSAQQGDTQLSANPGLFNENHVGESWMVRIDNIQYRFEITKFLSDTLVDVTLEDELPAVDGSTTQFQLGPHTDWQEPAIGNGRGGPRSVAFHDKRLWIGGVRDAPTQLWASVVGVNDRFTLGLNADDAISFAARIGGTLPRIHDVTSSQQGLQVFTTSGVGLVPSNLDNAITPTNISFIEQTSVGSNGTSPTRTKTITVYAQDGGRRINELTPVSLQEQNDTSLSLRAEHLINHPIRLDYVSDAFGIEMDLLFVVNRDGTLNVLARRSEEQVMAWSTFSSVGALFRDVCVVGQEIFLIVDRNGNGAIERLATDANFDGQVSRSFDNPVTQVALPQFANATVDVLTDDGRWYSDLVADENGLIDLRNGFTAQPGHEVVDDEYSATGVTVGYSPKGTIQTLTPRSPGASTMGIHKRIVAVTVDYLESRGISVGRAVDDGPVEWPNVLVSGNDPIETARKEKRFLGFSTSPTVIITHEGPFPATIRALETELHIGG